MLDLEAARIFTLVVQNQSFSETARKLGVSAPVISKQWRAWKNHWMRGCCSAPRVASA
jgi:DNA-binding transcriptional LysR family regulator